MSFLDAFIKFLILNKFYMKYRPLYIPSTQFLKIKFKTYVFKYNMKITTVLRFEILYSYK